MKIFLALILITILLAFFCPKVLDKIGDLTIKRTKRMLNIEDKKENKESEDN